MWIWYRLQDGIGCVEHGCGFDEKNVPPHDLMVKGTYDGFKKVIEGKIDPVRGLLSGQFKPVDCTLKVLIKNVALFNLFTESKKNIGWEH